MAVVSDLLLDTGPIVAFFDPRDSAHEEAKHFLANFPGQFVTTSTVITEAMYFLLTVRGGPAQFVQFLETTGARVIDFSATSHLRRAVELMTRYADTPMDFADATLVLAAEAARTDRICTLDRRGFSVFRTPAGRSFRLVLDAM